MSMRLRRLATVLEWLAGLSMLGLPIFLLSALLAQEALGIRFTPFSDVLSSAWTWNVWLGVVVLLAPSVLVLLALDAMRRLFRLYRFGDPLAPNAAPLIHRIGLNLLLSAVAKIVCTPVYTVLFTLQNPPGERSVAVEIGSGDIGFILVAGLLLLIGWSMSEAQRIAAENRQFV